MLVIWQIVCAVSQSRRLILSRGANAGLIRLLRGTHGIVGKRLVFDVGQGCTRRQILRHLPRFGALEAQDVLARADRAAHPAATIDRGLPEPEPAIKLAREPAGRRKVVEPLEDEVEPPDPIARDEKRQEFDDAFARRDLGRERSRDGRDRRVVVDRVPRSVRTIEQGPQALDEFGLHRDVGFAVSIGFVDVVQRVAQNGLALEFDEPSQESIQCARMSVFFAHTTPSLLLFCFLVSTVSR